MTIKTILAVALDFRIQVCLWYQILDLKTPVANGILGLFAYLPVKFAFESLFFIKGFTYYDFGMSLLLVGFSTIIGECFVWIVMGKELEV